MEGIKTAAILACAGSGNRMKKSCSDKLLLEMDGIPVAVYTLLAYDQAETIDSIVVVTREDLVPLFCSFKVKYGIKKDVLVTVGGATRMESVLNGVRLTGAEFVAIGDGARPLIRPEDIDRTVRVAHESGAAALGVHLTDTIKEVREGTIKKTVPRDVLVGIQTPQVFARNLYLELAERAAESGEVFTDDASIFERFEKNVILVEGHRDNIKITVPEDIAIFRALMEERK